MSDSPYRVLGVGVPPMLGRERLFGKLCRHLNKPTPDHVSRNRPRHVRKVRPPQSSCRRF